MQQHKPFLHDGRYWVVVIFVSLLLFVSLFGGAIGSLQAQDPVLPATPPDSGNGITLYQDRCATCHGDTGAGDGPMAPNMMVTPKDLSDPEYRKTADPAAIYHLITNGNLETGMPPFGPPGNTQNPIAENGRWDLVATIYTLSTPPEAITNGEIIYTDNCAACHGTDGKGEGDPALDISGLAYWFNRSNAAVYDQLAGDTIPEHTYNLSEDDLWNVVDYSRTFSYAYLNPSAPIPPIPSATISGEISNGSTGDLISEEIPVRLRAFTPDFAETFNQTTTLKTDGTYQFDLLDISPEWIFIASATYNDLSFSSNAQQVNRADPVLDLPITVYNTTADPRAIQIGQLHVVIDFLAEDRIAVTELYVFNNLSNGVFVGATGNADEGTVQIQLPANAEGVLFERTLGNMQSTFPATEVIQMEDGSFFDTLPLRPGNSASTLIATYELPYDRNGLDINHPLPYHTVHASLILPDAGLEVGGEGWTFQGAQQMSSGISFASYSQTALADGADLALRLSGQPDFSGFMGDGNAVATPRNENIELIIGGVLFATVLAVAVYVVYSSQQTAVTDDDFYAEAEGTTAVNNPIHRDDVQEIIQTIAKLDNAYEIGEVEEETYNQERQALKEKLIALWE